MREEKLNNIPPISSKIEELKKLFPEYFDKSGKFLIEKFNQDIQNQTDISKETYSLEWLGKSYARVLASEPVRTLLKENIEWNNKEENKNSQNILIKGDNLEVLKHLVSAYENKIKMIYIDPPYNTGNDNFVYQDDRKFTPEELSKLAGINIEKAKRILDFVNSKSNSHSAWLTFMYPRLYIARRLLKEDGVIFISIDDNEVAQLKLIMDEIFGEENFMGNIIWDKGNAQNDAMNIQQNHEYMLVFSKNKNNKVLFQRKLIKEKIYKDENGYFFKKTSFMQGGGEGSILNKRPNLGFSIYYNPHTKDIIPLIDYDKEKAKYSNIEDEVYQTNEELIKKGYKVIRPPKKGNLLGCWTWGIEKFKENLQYIEIELPNKIIKKEYIEKPYIIKNMNNIQKYIERETLLPLKSILKFASNEGSKYLNKLLGNKVFNNPKPHSLIKFLINSFVKEKDFFVLDFFAGSGTTGDAVMQLNAEDEGDRKFILVQLPEPIDPKKNKVAYEFVKKELEIYNPTIYDITKERLIRSAKKIKEEYKDKKYIDTLDFGFKEFETINLPEENLKDIEELKEEINLFKEISDKNALLTTWKVFDGIELHKELIEIDLNGYKGYYLENKLYLVDKGFSIENLASILEKIDNDENFIPSKIVINGYVFDSKTQREIYESINNYNKKDLDKIELIIRY